MIMDLLGPSLEDLFQSCKRKLDLKTVLLISQQLVKNIQQVHEMGLIHRDIKPDNFLIGGKEETRDQVLIIDFGLAKTFRTPTGEHIPYKDGKNLTGTARYASLATHQGIEQSRRDDMEAIGNLIVYLLMGNLPWQGCQGKTKPERYEEIKRIKADISIDDLCLNQPDEFKQYMHYCRQLKFDEEPDYKLAIGFFESCLVRHEYDPTVFNYTWKTRRLD